MSPNMNTAIKKHIEAARRSLEKARRIQASQRANPTTQKYITDAHDLVVKADTDGQFVAS